MSCPTCAEEMDSVAIAGQGNRLYWCPRCGTRMLGDFVDVPELVTRCRSLHQKNRAWNQHDLWQKGITEACFKPEERPA